MSNILIIKHGSLGDIAQISGVLKDIRGKHSNNEKIFMLTTAPYAELLSSCPFIDAVLIDQRLNQGHLGGMWEFPGGKKEPKEDIEETIIREL